MFKYLSAALIALLPLITQPAAAATVPVIDVPAATADYVSFADAGDLLIFDAPAVGMGFAYSGDLFADLALSFELADPYGSATGFFTLRGDTGEMLSAVLSSVRAGTDDLTLIFDDLTGALSGRFTPGGLRMTMFFFDPMGADPLRALTDGTSYDVAMTVAPVPLPAGAVLLVSGLGLLVLRRRRPATA